MNGGCSDRMGFFWHALAVITLEICMTGCATATRQLVPRSAASGVHQDRARIVLKRNTWGLAAVIRDGNTEIGTLGSESGMEWERPAGHMFLTAAGTGMTSDMRGYFMGDVKGGEKYEFSLPVRRGLYRSDYDFRQDSGPAITPIQIPVCVLPVVDATGGKGLDLVRYSKAHKLPAVQTGGYFPANYALREFKLRQYTKPFYGGANADMASIHESAKRGQVTLPILPKDGSPAYYVLIAVNQFEQWFRVVWLVESKVEVFVIQASTGKVVSRLTGEASGRAGMIEVIDRGLIVAQEHPDYNTSASYDAWQATICRAVTDALKKMPILDAQ